jgi:flagellar biosynthesis protein FlhF
LYESFAGYSLLTYLVLSATTKYKDLKKITDLYKDITDCSLIFTKLDETDAIGNILNIKLDTGMSLSYISYGQNVPDDIEVMNPQIIAKQVLGGGDGYGSGR